MAEIDYPPNMHPNTVVYVAELAESSFERQAELNESIWRSLPFFAASLGLGATIIGRAAGDVPSFGMEAFRLITNGLLAGSAAAFIWALRWFWDVVRGRDFEIPASDDQVRNYAEKMTAFHQGQGLVGDTLDSKVVEELRLFMIDQFGEAARVNFRANATRTLSRSQVLLFMMVGFVLAFACESIIFVHKSVNTPTTGALGDSQHAYPSSGFPSAASGSSKSASGDGRRVIQQGNVGPADTRQIKNERQEPAIRETSALCACYGTSNAATSAKPDENRAGRCSQEAKSTTCEAGKEITPHAIVAPPRAAR